MAIAHKLLPRTSHTNSLSVPGHELARVGVGLLAIWLAAKALPALVWFFFRAYLFTEAGSSFSSLPPEMKLDLAVAVIELALALVAVAKSGAIAKFISPPMSDTGDAPDLYNP